MTRQDESLAISMMRGAQTMNKVAKAVSKENNAPKLPAPRVWSKPIRGSIPSLCGSDLDGFVTTDEPFEGEQSVLIVPLTPECVGALYDKLVKEFEGIANRFDLAATVLSVIGIEREARRPAPLFQEDVA
jgi:hypothetical protein